MTTAIIQLLGVAFKRVINEETKDSVDTILVCKVINDLNWKAPELCVQLLIEALSPMKHCEECGAIMTDERELIGYHKKGCSNDK